VVEGSDIYLDQPSGGSPPPAYHQSRAEGIWAAGDKIAWISGLVLALSAFMDWYAGSGLGVKLAVIGWHTGTAGKIVFFIGLAVVAIEAFRAFGFDLPASLPDGIVLIVLGGFSTVLVLIHVINIPDAVLPADSRGVGIWVSLIASLGIVAGGLLRATEDL
jgi:hypothetical protein